MDRKGAYNYAIAVSHYIVAAIFIAFLFFYMSHLIRMYNDAVVVDTQRVEGGIIAAEAVMSPKCFAYQDKETGRVYPGIIDMDKFNPDSFGKGCFPYIQSAYSFDLEGNAVKSGEKAGMETVNVPVLVIKGNKLQPEIMKAGVEDYYAPKGQKGPTE